MHEVDALPKNVLEQTVRLIVEIVPLRKNINFKSVQCDVQNYVGAPFRSRDATTKVQR